MSLFSRYNKIRRALAVIRKGGDTVYGDRKHYAVKSSGRESWCCQPNQCHLSNLDKSVHRVETFAAMEQLASVLRSASRDG